MNIKTAAVVICLIALFSCSSGEITGSGIDKNLIVPGMTAEGFNIGERIEEGSFKIYESRENSISAVLGVNYFAGLKFDSVIYNDKSSVLFLQNGVITAIAGLNVERRITSDAVLLSRGVDNFILNYGNNGLSIVKESVSSIFIYKNPGIAIFDDGNDNTINMYLVFK